MLLLVLVVPRFPTLSQRSESVQVVLPTDWSLISTLSGRCALVVLVVMCGRILTGGREWFSRFSHRSPPSDSGAVEIPHAHHLAARSHELSTTTLHGSKRCDCCFFLIYRIKTLTPIGTLDSCKNPIRWNGSNENDSEMGATLRRRQYETLDVNKAGRKQALE